MLVLHYVLECVVNSANLVYRLDEQTKRELFCNWRRDCSNYCAMCAQVFEVKTYGIHQSCCLYGQNLMNANDARDMNVFSNASVATVLGIIIVYALLVLLLCSCPVSRLPPCNDNAR